jgi:hypothetical protein
LVRVERLRSSANRAARLVGSYLAGAIAAAAGHGAVAVWLRRMAARSRSAMEPGPEGRAGAAALALALFAAGPARAVEFSSIAAAQSFLGARAKDGSAVVGTELREYFDGLPVRAREWLDAAVERELVSEPEHLRQILSLRLPAGQLELFLHDNCALCHTDPATQDPETLFSVDPAAAGSPAHLDLREFVSDVHFRRGLSCAGCHGGKPTDEEMADEIYDRWAKRRRATRTAVGSRASARAATPIRSSCAASTPPWPRTSTRSTRRANTACACWNNTTPRPPNA